MQYGFFDDLSREYVVTKPDTPKPWANYIGNAQFGSVLTNNAAGYTFYKSASQGRLTRFRFAANPALLPGKFIYLKDMDANDFWSNSWFPTCKPLDEFKYECRHGSGYTKITSEYNGVSSSATYFVPLDSTYEVWRISVTNNTDKSRNVKVFPFIEPQCNWNASDDTDNLQYTQYIVKTECSGNKIDIGSNVNMPEDKDNFENKDQKRHTFFMLGGADAAGFDSDYEQFIGTYGTYQVPKAVVEGKCSNSLTAADMACGAFEIPLDLAPGETREFVILYGVGQADTVGEASLKEMGTTEQVEVALQKVKGYWHGRLNTLHADTPDEEFNSMLNMWAPYNNLMTFYWSRTASLVYAGARDGLGYRDTAQDIVGASALIIDEAGERLELLIKGQYENGGCKPVVKPFAHNPGHEELPEHFRSDDALWLFNAVPEYVKETGNFDFYNKVLPFADKSEATVFMHLRKALEFSINNSGPHGFPYGLHADWNDCVRLGATGETIFVAFQLRFGFKEYIEIAERLGEAEEAKWAAEKMAELDKNLEEHAWDGDWYMRAYREDGFKFGSKESDEGSIFMNPQAWAVISGHATGEKAEKCMSSLDEKLATDHGVMLCDPPYVSTDPQIALGRLFNPGMKENGGVFNHTQGWAVMAQAELGNNELAWQYLKNVLPSSFNTKAEVREVEPYVVCQSTHSSRSPKFGTGRVSWLSGSAVWNYYVMTHTILGIKPHYDGLELSPCIPAEWDGYSVEREFRGSQFSIKVKRGSANKVTVNGEEISGNVIKSDLFNAENNVVVEIV